MRAHITTSSEGRSIIILFDENGDIATINESHPNFTRIAQAVRYNEDPSQWLNSTTDWFEAEYLDDDFDGFGNDDDEYADDFDPAPVVESLSETIERYRREGRDATGLVKFMHRLARNPSRRSREQLFTWTQAKDLTIDLDGYVVGFKGIAKRYEGSDLFPLERYPYESCASGHGIVDGIEIKNGNLPMGVGAVISIPRDEVQDDPNIGCHVGLHVGTHSYAKGYSNSGAMVEVRFDPANVVSVPSDCGFAKLRCCEYEVVAIHEPELGDDLSAHEAEATWDEEEAFDDSLADVVPAGFFANLKARVLRKGKS